MRVVIILFFELASLIGLAQGKPDSLQIRFLFQSKTVSDSADLTVSVVYKNLTNHSVDVYSYLEEGDRGDRFFNFNVEMEKFDQKQFIYYPMRFYSNPLLYRMEDSLRHYDLPKKKLLSFASDTLSINLLTIGRMLPPGRYRFRAHLRVKTLPDTRAYNDPNFETPPPSDEIIYVASKWFIFTVNREISARSYRMQGK
jgi:hypothetical protein